MDMTKKLFEGSGGGGGSAATPSNAPDSLFSEDVVEFALAISEGPIKGLVEGAKSFYVGDTALRAQNDLPNFEKFAIGLHPGYPEGQAKPILFQLGGETSNNSVGVALKNDVPVVRTTSAGLRGTIDVLEVRINFSRLYVTNSNGTFPNTAKFVLEYKATNSAEWTTFYNISPVQVTGKTSSGYVRDFQVQVPRLTNADWMVRVTKLPSTSNPSPDPAAPTVNGEYADLIWESMQTTTKELKSYPDTAIIHGIGVANGQFSSIPDFSGIYDGLIIRVPTNYNPVDRTYDESTPWDGSFKFAWTNNPAWVLYDLIVNPRYGLAAHTLAIDPNRFDFYLAAKWCDAPVPTGGMVVVNGQTVPEMQPRYTFNDVITEGRPIREAIAYVAGSFNALIWDDMTGQIHLRVDKDEPAVMMFTPESVTAEGFAYSFTDIAVRANDISVAFINPDLDWNEDRRRVPNYTTDEAAIAKYGRVPLDFVAVGCTNAAEALRKARVRLISAQTETTTVSFVTTRPGALLNLFDVILIADPTMGWSQSGRITKVDHEYIYFRDAIYFESIKSYTLKLQGFSGVEDFSVRPESTGNVTRLKLETMLPLYIPNNTTFTLEETGGFGYAKPFRVTSISEVDGSPYQYAITAIEINRSKYFDAENQTTTQEFQYSYKEPAVPGIPEDVEIDSGDAHLFISATGVVTNRIFIQWKKNVHELVKAWEVQWQRIVDKDWNSLTTDQPFAYIDDIFPGVDYAIRVRAVGLDGQKSLWYTRVSYQAKGKKAKPLPVTDFEATGDLFQVHLKWKYAPQTLDAKKVVVYYCMENNLSRAIVLAEISAPTDNWTHFGLAADTTVYYWLRVADSSGNLSVFSDVRSATTLKDPFKLLDILEGQIRDSELHGSLKDRIDLIDGPYTMPGSVNDRILKEANARADALEAYAEEQRTALAAEVQNRINAIQQEADARLEAILAEVANRKAAILEEKTIRQSNDESLSNQLVVLNSLLDANQALILEERTARTTADSALANDLTGLRSVFNENQATLTQTLQTLVDADAAQAADVRNLRTEFDNNTAQVQNSLLALSNQDQSLASSIQSLAVKVGQNEASATSQMQIITNDQAALASSLSNLATTVAENKSSAETKLTSLATEDAALATRIDSLTSTVGENKATVEDKIRTMADADTALANSFSSLNTTVAENKASADSQISAVTTLTTVISQSVATLNAKVNDNKALADTKFQAAADATTAVSNRIDTLTTTVNQNTSAINAEVIARSDAISAETAARQALRSEFQAQVSSTLNAAKTFTQDYAYSKAAADSAMATTESRITAEYKTYADEKATQAITTASADVRDYAYSKASTDAAISNSIQTITTTVGNHTTTLQTQAQSINGLKALYSLKIDNNGHVSGFGLSSENMEGGGTISSFIINADRFAVVYPGASGSGTMPFIIGKINGINTIGINGNLLLDGSVAIRDATGNIIFSSGHKLHATYIQEATVDSLQIKGNAVTQTVSSVTNTSQIEVTWSSDVAVAQIGAVELTGTQPILIFANVLAAGAHVTGLGETADVIIGGTPWTNNPSDADCSFKCVITNAFGTYQIDLSLNQTVIKGTGQNVAMQGTFTGANIPPAGIYSITVYGRVTGGYWKVGMRYGTVSMLETRR